MTDLLDTYARETAFSEEQVAAFAQQLDRDRRLPAPSSRLRALRWPTAALAVAAALFLLVRPPPAPTTGHRAIGPAPAAPEQGPAQVTLRLAIEQGSVPQLLQPDQPAAVGDRIFFRVSTTGAGPIAVWADGPTGRQALSRFEAAGAGETDVPLGDALLAWRFDVPGVYRFWASTAPDGSCPPQACDFREVTVR